jgi:DsbC/DsbD-like thiol-disulfide interchange protein
MSCPFRCKAQGSKLAHLVSRQSRSASLVVLEFVDSWAPKLGSVSTSSSIQVLEDGLATMNCSFSPRFVVFLIWAVWLMLPTAASSQVKADEYTTLSLVSEQDAIVRGKQLWIGIRFELQEGWHTYWTNPGDSGEPPRIEWQLPTGFQVSDIQWPHPVRLVQAYLADYGYEDQVLLMAAVRPPERLKEGESTRITAQVHYLVCHDVCIPGQKHLELSVPVKTSAAFSPARPLFVAARQKLPRPMPRNWKISAISTADEFVVKTDKLAKPVQFFPLHTEQIENAAPQNLTEVPGGLRLHLKKSEHLLKPITRLEGVIVLASGDAYLVRIPVAQSGTLTPNRGARERLNKP